VGDEDLLELDQPDRLQQLTLGALAAVEQQAIAAAPDERGGKPTPRAGSGAGGADEEDVEVDGAIVAGSVDSRQSTADNGN
jgi:hypothetical protein